MVKLSVMLLEFIINIIKFILYYKMDFWFQAENNMEYVIEAHDTDDMRSWLATVKYCMRSTPSDTVDTR